MERLTTTNKDVSREMICRNENCGVTEEHCPHLMEDECACLREVINKLADYEDAEEQGLLLRLPCKVGDTVWLLGEKFILDYEVRRILVSECGIEAVHIAKEVEGVDRWNSFYAEDIGKAVFLTKEEAESALAEKGGV